MGFPALAALAFGATVVANSWLGDDAYITLRTVEAVLRGDGPVWNPGERVQAYTHPAWMAVLVVSRVLIDHAYFALLTAGWLFTAIAAVLLVRVARRPERGAVLLLVALFSKSFVHYATSGLENPLSHTLLLALALVLARGRTGAPSRRGQAPPRRGHAPGLQPFGIAGFFGTTDTRIGPARPRAACQLGRKSQRSRHVVRRERVPARAVRNLGLLGALLLLTRMDLALLAGPAVLFALWRERDRGWATLAKALAPGMALLLGWELFSLLYYGAPVPNTAYAKLGTGIPRHELVDQGLAYLGAGLTWDPLTPVVIGLGALTGLVRVRRDPAGAGWALGCVAYVGYVVWFGGGFMNGRFTTAPFLVALIVLARTPLPRRGRPAWAVVALGLAVVLGVVVPARSTFDVPVARSEGIRIRGITDEQAFYFQDTGLFSEGDEPMPRHPLRARGEALGEGEVMVAATVGFLGHAAADRATLLDPLGLTDPLLGRLPAARNQRWRVGHALREVPEGYEATVRADACRMEDPDLCAYWRHLRRITRGPLLSRERLASIWKLNTGQLAHLVDREAFRRPHLVRRRLEGVTDGARFRDSGLLVTLPRRVPRGAVRVATVGPTELELIFRADGEETCRRTVVPGAPVRCDGPFDALLVQPTSRPAWSGRHRIDGLTLHGAPDAR